MKKLLTVLFVCGAALAQTKATTAAKKAPAAAPNLMNPSSLNRTAPATYQAKFSTTQGDFIVQVTRAWAPLGADRFYNLVRAGYYNGVPFFRVIPGFMAQFGISADPKVNAVWMNANLKDDPVTQSNKRGLITFATAGPNTRTTQVFINYANNAGLDAQGFAPFGEVIEGMDVVEKFYSGYGGNPDQGSLMQLGKPWIEKHMPKVDSVKVATIVPATSAAPAATKSTAPATKSTTPTKQ
ncbi:MAG TPA: peptidylprolyl isomerase [Bryobacteraceae bacterium]|nr:peptidylprolyl isomerase [Bryobacteraceae bacterium]